MVYSGHPRTPVKNSIDLNDNNSRDSASNNNAKPLDNLLEATHKVFPEVNGNEVAANAMEILTTIPVTPDPLSSDGMANADGHWVRPDGWVQAEVTSNDSTAVRAEDSSMKQTTLPHGVESMAAVPKDLRPANTEEKKAFIEHLIHVIYELSQCNIWFLFASGVWRSAEELAEDTEIRTWVVSPGVER